MFSVGNCINEPSGYRDIVMYDSFALSFINDHFSCFYMCMKHRLYARLKDEIFCVHAMKAYRGSGGLRYIDW
jgi:hypothetical protein